MKTYTCPKNSQHEGVKVVSVTRPAAQDSQIICAECGEFIAWASPKDLVQLHTDLVHEINQSEPTRLLRELAGQTAAVEVLMAENAGLRNGLEHTANRHADKYELACRMSGETWEGTEHDQWVARRRMNEREWKRCARILLGDEYDCTDSPHHFPKNAAEAGK